MESCSTVMTHAYTWKNLKGIILSEKANLIKLHNRHGKQVNGYSYKKGSLSYTLTGAVLTETYTCDKITWKNTHTRLRAPETGNMSDTGKTYQSQHANCDFALQFPSG